MKAIKIGNDIKSALFQINNAGRQPITVEMSSEVGDMDVFTLLSIANAIKNHKYETIVIIRGVISFIPAITADQIRLDPNAMVYIIPIYTIVNEPLTEIEKEKQLKIILKLNTEIREYYEKYPKLLALFDDGEKHFLTKTDLIGLGVDII